MGPQLAPPQTSSLPATFGALHVQQYSHDKYMARIDEARYVLAQDTDLGVTLVMRIVYYNRGNQV